MGLDKNNTLSLKFKLPIMDTFLALSSKITHAKIITSFVNMDRYFIFKDFQLVSTIEEYERLLGWYMKDHHPFTKLGELLMPEPVAEALHLSVEEVTLGLGPRGFSRKFLEDKARALEK
ncbi:hypothetical protein KIW84_064909 [Lathyrus oleraceus]|uniref:DUF7745 domain-containing protein n=1 Tax=Pisum sativum TaxID=3888 RepID=A0A9D4WDV8_PEA|nr:hypothetical protein KIW84_064909 [Pisum sativum]